METEDSQVLIVGRGPARHTEPTEVGAIAVAGRMRARVSHRVASRAAGLQKPREHSATHIIFEDGTGVGLSSGAAVVPTVAPERRVEALLVAAGGGTFRLELRRRGWRDEGISACGTCDGELFRASPAAVEVGGGPVLGDDEVDFAWTSEIDEAPEDDFVTGLRVAECHSGRASFRWIRSSLASRARRIGNCFEGEIELEGGGSIRGGPARN